MNLRRMARTLCLAASCAAAAGFSGPTGHAGSAGGGDGCTRTVAPGADLQQALDSLGSDHDAPATLCLSAGEFRLPGFLSITHDGVRLRGDGPATVLRLEDAVESPVIVIGDHRHQVPTHVVADVLVERLRIVGNGDAGREAHPVHPYLTNSAVVVRSGQSITLRELDVSACRSACVLTEYQTRDVTIERNSIGGSTWDGISLNRTAAARVVDSIIRDNRAAGITAEHLEDSVIERNAITGNRSHGVYLADSYHNRFSGNRLARNTNAGVFLTCSVRHRDPGPVLCWDASMSADNTFDGNEFVANRLGYIVAADAAANCKSGAALNVSRADRFLDNPPVEQNGARDGDCLRLEEPFLP
jgi:parallel beta-helix repeat protein